MTVQPGRFDLRGALNDIPWLDTIDVEETGVHLAFGALGMKTSAVPREKDGARIIGTFRMVHRRVQAHFRKATRCSRQVVEFRMRKMRISSERWAKNTAGTARVHEPPGARKRSAATGRVVTDRRAGLFDSDDGTARSRIFNTTASRGSNAPCRYAARRKVFRNRSARVHRVRAECHAEDGGIQCRGSSNCRWGGMTSS